MSKRQIINPYTRLKDEMIRAWNKVEYPRRVFMWRYPKDKLDCKWGLQDLFDRVHAANACNYDVTLTANDDGISVHYVEKRPDRPSELI